MLAMTKRKYDYRRNLPHYQKDGRPVFITFNTNDRWQMPPAVRDIVLECCKHQHRKMVWLHIVVVMPEHAHLIVNLAHDGATGPFSVLEFMQNVKSVSAHKINRLLRHEGRVWQEESFDHVLRTDEHLEDRIEYVRQNPVRRRLCRHPGDYKWLWVNPEPLF
jgi:REP element-mobilizing transposase RayT